MLFQSKTLNYPKIFPQIQKPKEGYWQQTKIAIKSVMRQIGKYHTRRLKQRKMAQIFNDNFKITL